jgi:hypothetical protein
MTCSTLQRTRRHAAHRPPFDGDEVDDDDVEPIVIQKLLDTPSDVGDAPSDQTDGVP